MNDFVHGRAVDFAERGHLGNIDFLSEHYRTEMYGKNDHLILPNYFELCDRLSETACSWTKADTAITG